MRPQSTYKANFPALAAIVWLTGCGTSWEVVDQDGDNISVAQGDCWDAVEGPEGSGLSGADIHPGATESWYDGYDQDCAGDDDFDADGDGWVTEDDHVGQPTFGVPGSGEHLGAGDCWDAPADAAVPDAFVPTTGDLLTAAAVNPAATDSWYDDVDQDCLGDDDFDQDLDGFGSADHSTRAGDMGSDCDDLNDAVHPDATEICDSVDNDCDGDMDSADDDVDLSTTRTWYADNDGDSYGDADAELDSCDEPDDYVEDDTDCDDNNGDVNPAANEVCNDVDDDCDDDIDDADDSLDTSTGTEWYADNDGDSYGDPDNATEACVLPDLHVDNALDCDDADGSINPDAVEQCATVGIDDNCDGTADEDTAVDAPTWYVDDDGDSYGVADGTAVSCNQPSGYADNTDDCDDTESAVNPGATEVCNDIDDDCNGAADDDDAGLDTATATSWYHDSDADSYGDSADALIRCDQPADYISDATDCDDTDPLINPGATEVCDGDDNDCNGDTDDDDAGVSYDGDDVWYADDDTDGYGDPASTTSACDQPSGHVTDATDCDDTDTDINPAAAEVCDGDDNDCNGDTDDDDVGLDAATTTDWYLDDDADGYGDPGSSLARCDQPGDYVSDATDCDDTDNAINPAATEVCDGDDNDCNGDTDDDDAGLDAATTSTWYLDDDGDGYGLTASSVDLCDEPVGYSDVDGDCDDTSTAVSPAEVEVCNDGLDNDCDSTLGTRIDGTSTCELVDATVGEAEFIISGAGGADRLGRSVDFVGDVDGDGMDDIMVGSPFDDIGGYNAGSAWLFNGVGATVDPESSNSVTSASRSVGFEGRATKDSMGRSFSGGDVDGDGYSDVVIGAYRYHSSDKGQGYFFYGPLTTGALNHTDADNEMQGSTTDEYASWALAMDGDVDGDGLADLAVGAPQSNMVEDVTAATAGAGYVALLTDSTIASGSFTGGDLLLAGNTLGDSAGFALAYADIDGDGNDELVASAPGVSSSAGAVYLIETSTTSSGYLGAGMLTYTGEAAGDLAGHSLAGGDLDGDGYDEVIIGALGEATGGAAAGAVYIFNGPITISETSLSLSTADVKITGSVGELAAYSMDAGSDVDGDGDAELLIGAPDGAGAAWESGTAYLFLGPISGTLATTDADVEFGGDVADDSAGWGVGAGGDVDNDGYDDLLVGAPDNDDNVSNGGAAYLFLGLGY